MKKKVVFIVPNVYDTHYKNRITEFINHNIDIAVYGFKRETDKTFPEMPYGYSVLGTIRDEDYVNRVKVYIKQFRKIGEKYNNENVIFYLCGLDIAMFFHLVNPSSKYIYEECDLTYTYMGWVKYLFKWIDKKIIKRAQLAITTSEGFVRYHYGEKIPNNVVLVENKLNPNIIDYKVEKQKEFSGKNMSLGFVGMPRFNSVYSFIDIFCRNFPDGTFHVYGGPITPQFATLKKHKNCIFHGFFKNPSDLPEIYANIDLVIATYDVKYENVRYAEPNKIYEAIYFETPILVSSRTFLAEKVKRLGIGYDIDAKNETAVVEFIKGLTKENLQIKRENIKKIDKNSTINVNEVLFEKLEFIIKEKK